MRPSAHTHRFISVYLVLSYPRNKYMRRVGTVLKLGAGNDNDKYQGVAT